MNHSFECSSFINAIVQCLCHTEQLALYILRKGYEIDMRNIKNAILDYQHSSSSSQAHGFKVTKSFVQIFQALWNNSSNTTSKLSYDFKSLIGNLNRQYSGNEQNDAQEFLLFLINTIHDELNLAVAGRLRSQTKVSSFQQRNSRRISIVYLSGFLFSGNYLFTIVIVIGVSRIGTSGMVRLHRCESKYHHIRIQRPASFNLALQSVQTRKQNIRTLPVAIVTDSAKNY
jgi:ubiquitin C-terminal hydrolase